MRALPRPAEPFAIGSPLDGIIFDPWLDRRIFVLVGESAHGFTEKKEDEKLLFFR